MRITAIASLILIVVGHSIPHDAMADMPDETKVLDRFVGTWEIDETMKTGNGRVFKASGLTTVKSVLGGRYLDFVRVNNPSGQEIYGVYTYDESRKQFRSWFYSSSGPASEWSGTWDEATKTLTRTADLGWGTGKATSRFIDADTFEFVLVGTNRDDKVIVEVTSKFTRQRDAKPIVQKKSEGPSASPPELKTLDVLTGHWSDDVVSKAAVWTPEDVRFQSESEKFWILGGKYVFQEMKDDIFLTTYSASEKAVKMWHFNTAGYSHEWTGIWNEEKNVLTMTSDLDGNPTVSAVLKQTFAADRTNTWSAIATDNKGKVYHHLEGVAKRRVSQPGE